MQDRLRDTDYEFPIRGIDELVTRDGDDPGLRNFAEVRAGRILAHDGCGPVLCPRDGQASGVDGVFLVEETSGVA